MAETRFLGNITTSSIKNFFPKSLSATNKFNKKSKFNAENVAPLNPNIITDDNHLSSSINFPQKSSLKVASFAKEVTKIEAKQEEEALKLDPPVKVVVRIRPASGGDRTVRKVADDVISVGDRKFAFDSIFDLNSTQDDVFQLVGVPLVKNALAGYNTSILAYGQSGSGKSFTMWGPPSAMVDCPSEDGPQGIAPRVFQSLFADIQREQENSEGRQINYQFRCSFLEIYNDQIGDLLDPTQRNLEINDDAKTGFYIENLTEEYVACYEDVTQIMIKGLSSRKVGATSNNSKSSRSHIVFTCMIESWCKESSSKCFGSSRTSRISLIDLAGFEKNMVDDAGKNSTKERKFVKKSTSQLGHLVNLLVSRNENDDPDRVPYKTSCLTHLLKQSLGGNAKLSVICSISSGNKCVGETVSTLRFGQRVKMVQNKPMINQITEDDVNDLSDRIRQLKDELIREKANSGNTTGNVSSYSRSRSTRESLNQLRLSINRSLLLPRIENDSEKEVQISEHDVKELHVQIETLQGASDDDVKDTSSRTRDSTRFFSAEGCGETDITCEQYMSCSDISEDDEEISSEAAQPEALLKVPEEIPNEEMSINHASKPSIEINSHHQPTILEGPMLSESPKIRSNQRSMVLPLDKEPKQDVLEIYKSTEMSHRPSDIIRSSLRYSRVFSGPTESLAASLHRGLQIIDHHQRNSMSDRSSVSFSFEHLAIKPSSSADKVSASLPTLSEERESVNAPSASYLCVNCQKTEISSPKVQDSLKEKWIVSVNDASKDANVDLVQPTTREQELQTLCKEQEAKIGLLNQMLMQYKKETDQNAIMECHDDAPHSLETKVLTWSAGDNLMTVSEDVDRTDKRKSYDENERGALLMEIESLKKKLQVYTDSSAKKSIDKIRSSLLSQSMQLRKSRAFTQGLSEEELEKEREKLTEMESEWISLTDELRIDIEYHRQHAEQMEMELRLEKKCTEELDDVVKRSVLAHARMVEHYVELQERYNDLAAKHKSILGGVEDIKRAAARAGTKGCGSRFQKAMVKELSALRVEREREREMLKKENISLKMQLRDTADAVHAAGELLARLREAEEAEKIAEERFTDMQEENERLKKQIEKVKRKHKMEIVTMKQFLAESRLPGSAIQPLYRQEDSDSLPYDDDQAWKAEFGAIYQEHL
ncbi:microtubule binding motor protein [Lithospermum erythrorhizon]|uniref:Microtubule binding motor protein n=1 Tax=Lithospermum erythrorhizon TaxID=34254 RepID=A0AAV3QIZ7_LITER